MAQGRAPRPGHTARGLPGPPGAPRSPRRPSGRLRERVGAPSLPAAPSPERRDKMLPGLRSLLQGRDLSLREGREHPAEASGAPPPPGREGGAVVGVGVAWEEKRLAPGPAPAPRAAGRSRAPDSEPAGLCGELVTEGGRRGQADRPRGVGREAQVLLSRLHLLWGTPRTRAGWGSADSATSRAPCLSTFQSPGRTRDEGRGLSGRMGEQREIQMALRGRTDGGR